MLPSVTQSANCRTPSARAATTTASISLVASPVPRCSSTTNIDTSERVPAGSSGSSYPTAIPTGRPSANARRARGFPARSRQISSVRSCSPAYVDPNAVGALRKAWSRMSR